LCEMTWSLTSPRATRINGAKKFQSSPKKDLFNSIGANRSFGRTLADNGTATKLGAENVRLRKSCFRDL